MIASRDNSPLDNRHRAVLGVVDASVAVSAEGTLDALGPDVTGRRDMTKMLRTGQPM